MTPEQMERAARFREKHADRIAAIAAELAAEPATAPTAETWTFDVGSHTVRVVADAGQQAATIEDADGHVVGLYVGPDSEQDALRKAASL
jgi:hypothetical protein